MAGPGGKSPAAEQPPPETRRHSPPACQAAHRRRGRHRLGGGFELALACDLIVASTTARFALPEARRGLVATSGALFRAIRALPPRLARKLLITGAELDAERGYQLGLVNRVMQPGQALAGALQVADESCASSPVSVQATLAAIAAQLQDDDKRGWHATTGAISAIRSGQDMTEISAAARLMRGWVRQACFFATCPRSTRDR
jgi:enoyl-CoA hydratase/carnithine racemase